MVVFDATYVVPLITPSLKTPPRDEHNNPIPHYRERLEGLVARLDESRTKIILPSPALSEVLIRAEDAAAEYLEALRGMSALKVESFDEKAAIEAAILSRDAIQRLGDKKAGSQKGWQQVKFDRQVVAIAKVHHATTIYTQDKGLAEFARQAGITTIRIEQLPLPIQHAQAKLFQLPEGKKS